MMEETIDRIVAVERELGELPAVRQRELKRATERIRTAKERAERALAEATAEADGERHEVKLKTRVIRKQFDQERRELRTELGAERTRLQSELDQERQRHDLELAAALRRHAVAMETDRQRLVDQAAELMRRSSSLTAEAIRDCLDELVAVKPVPLRPTRRSLLSEKDGQHLRHVRELLERALKHAEHEVCELRLPDLHR
jgi:hypothetical protein